MSLHTRRRVVPGTGSTGELAGLAVLIAVGLSRLVEWLQARAHTEANDPAVRVRAPVNEAELSVALRQHAGEAEGAASRHGASDFRIFSEPAIEPRPVLVVDLEEGRDYFDLDALEEELGIITGLRPHIVTSASVLPEERADLKPLR